MFEVTLIPIVAAAIANVILGFIWYHPKVLGDAWMRAANISPQAAETGKRKMPVMAFLAFLAAMVIAYVLNHFGIAWGVFDWISAVELGIWSWIGFTAPVLLGSVLWEQKSFKYYLITASFWLISFIVMSIVLVVLG